MMKTYCILCQIEGIEIIVSEDDIAAAAERPTQPQIPIKGAEFCEACI